MLKTRNAHGLKWRKSTEFNFWLSRNFWYFNIWHFWTFGILKGARECFKLVIKNRALLTQARKSKWLWRESNNHAWSTKLQVWNLSFHRGKLDQFCFAPPPPQCFLWPPVTNSMLLYSTLLCKKIARAPEGHENLCTLSWDGEQNRPGKFDIVESVSRIQVMENKSCKIYNFCQNHSLQSSEFSCSVTCSWIEYKSGQKEN